MLTLLPPETVRNMPYPLRQSSTERFMHEFRAVVEGFAPRSRSCLPT